MWDNRQAY
jgi:hypothetical protein